MEVSRCRYAIACLLLLFFESGCNETIDKKKTLKDHKNCPFSKVIEEVFKVHNKTNQTDIYMQDSDRAKQFLNSISNITDKSNESSINRSLRDDQVNDIIASINRIKENITSEKNLRNHDEDILNEAIILSFPKINKTDGNDFVGTDVIVDTKQNYDINKNIFAQLKSEPADTDIFNLNVTSEDLIQKADQISMNTKEKPKEKPTYVEIMTIEPNNVNKNNSSSHNIIEILKHLMPMFNSTMTKELHNITVIERDRSRNHSFSEVKNISTIIVTYCDNENFSKANLTFGMGPETEIKMPQNDTTDDDFLEEEIATPLLEDSDSDYDDDRPDANLTIEERKDIKEAGEYGIKKMHELYSIMEPKLYSMGLWLDDTNPARYVAAFNAPSEDAAKFSRYGYASLQAATRLKQLTSGSNNEGLEGRAEEAQFPSASALRQSPLLEHCPIRGIPKCPPASKRYRTHDGTCNNFNRPRWGSTMTPVQRFLTPSYSDGLQAPRRSVTGAKLPSAREISSSVHEDKNVETQSITHLLMQWGQFLDHDVTSSSQSRGFNGSVPRCCVDGGRDFVPREFMHPECLPISVPASDPFYGPRGVRCLDFVRSSPAPKDDCSLGWREQLNQVSAYIDGSPLYGSSARKSDKLRLFRNGMLQYGRVQQRRPILPPERRDELCRGGAVSTECFKSGDARVNEHPGLVAAHIVWLRQHNRMAQELAHLNPHWSDEKIYQETRKIVGAMIQHITYKEFLPIVLGTEVMRLFELDLLKKGYYKNYSLKINPSPASSFGSAAFRFGHSLVQPSMVRFDRFHRPINNNVSLHDEQTNPSNIWSMGAVDRLLLGMVNQPIQKRDEFITEELTNHLFQTPSFDFGMDLAAINIQRGRDHGVPPYTAFREPCGLSQITEIEDLFRVMPASTVRKLQVLYRHVDDIDLFTGGMAERPVIGGLVGPTFSCIIAQQFSNLRKGDRFWYENEGFDSSLTPAQLQQIRRITFAQVLCRTLDNIDNIQPFVFLSSDSPDNQRISCLNGQLNNFDLSPWIEIDFNSNNDISKSENSRIDQDVDTPTKTTSKPTVSTAANKKPQKQPPPLALSLTDTTKVQNSVSDNSDTKLNQTKTVSDKKTDKTKPNVTTQKIDDKLDFKNKSRRYENTERIDERRDRPTNPNSKYSDYNDYDDEDVQSVQSVVINNSGNKRPSSYNRPISVTENIDKYTYLINYVPRPTQSWRHTTRRPYTERDIVKVTYQTYDDTYRRPNKPYYYNRQDERPMTHSDYDYRHNKRPINADQDYRQDERPHYEYRKNRPNRYTTKRVDYHSSARSNDEMTLDKTDIRQDTTTENSQKLVTFGYVGTYKGNDLTNTEHKPTVEYKTNQTSDDVVDANISRDFTTYDNDKHDIPNIDTSMKLSTFFLYETTTKPYNQQRSTRRDDEEPKPNFDSTNSKYYYVRNVLHTYPDIYSTLNEKPLPIDEDKDIIKENYNSPGWPSYMDVQERSAEKISALDGEDMPKSAAGQRKAPQKNTPKTPSVAFQVMPSENSPSQWAVYEENSNLPDSLPHKMPIFQTDPYALKEIPRPMDLSRMKKGQRRRP